MVRTKIETKTARFFLKKILIRFHLYGLRTSLRLSLFKSIQNNFRKIWFFRRLKNEEVANITIYDRDIRKKFYFSIWLDSIFALDELFLHHHYLLYLDEIVSILNKKFSKSKFSILDIGAHVGCFCIYYYRLLSPYLGNEIALYLFEAHPDNVGLLKENLIKNNIRYYEIFQNAICEKSGDYIDLFVGGSHTGCTIMQGEQYVLEQSRDIIKVKTLKVDDLKLESVGLIKIDAEGAEDLAIRGLTDTIIRNRPVVICSYEHKTNNKDSITKRICGCGEYQYKDDKVTRLLYFLPAV